MHTTDTSQSHPAQNEQVVSWFRLFPRQRPTRLVKRAAKAIENQDEGGLMTIGSQAAGAATYAVE